MFTFSGGPMWASAPTAVRDDSFTAESGIETEEFLPLTEKIASGRENLANNPCKIVAEVLIL